MDYFKLLYVIDKFQSKYVISIDKLVSIPILVPEMQRDVNEERVDEIVQYQLDFFSQHGSFCYLSDIILVKIDGSFMLIDGHHRYKSMKRIYLTNVSYPVTVTIIESLAISDIFELINKAEPVPEYIMKTTLDMKKRHVLENFSKDFCKIYKPYISKAKTPRRPNFDLDTFRKNLLDSVAFSSLNTVQELMSYISYINVNKWKDMDPKNSKLSVDKSLKHFDVSPLFLTNDVDNVWIRNSSWVDEFRKNVGGYSDNKTTDALKLKKSPMKRKPFPKVIRTQVWKSYFPENTIIGKCMCCQQEIHYDRFEIGHIVSVCNGGTNTLENLLPICGACNRSCGGKNLMDFAKEYNMPLFIKSIC